MSTAIAERPVSTGQKPGPAELHRQMATLNIHKRAIEAGMNLSAYLEYLDPSEEYKDGLDAFGRQLKVAGIRTQSDPAAGFYADTMDKFLAEPNNRALVHEWTARKWRQVTLGPPTTRGLLTSDIEGLNTLMRPYVDDARLRFTSIRPAIPLSELVAVTTPISGDAYRYAYFTDVTADQRMVRVEQTAEIPRVLIRTSENTVKLYKYGRAIEMSYEHMRRMRIDKMGLFIAQMAVTAENDRVAAVLDVIINGDGNTATAATTHNLTVLDTAATVAGGLTLKAWLAFKLKFANPYALTTVLSREAIALDLLLQNTGTGNIPLIQISAALGLGGLSPINPELTGVTRYGITGDAPASQIVGIDRRFSIERVTEVGADITESERFVMRQTQAIVMSEVEGFAVLFPASNRILNLLA